MKLRPTKDRVFVKVTVPEDISDGGIALPVDREGDPKDNPDRGVIVDMGDMDEMVPDIKVGDTVVFKDHYTTNTGMKDVLIIDMKDILAVLEPDDDHFIGVDMASKDGDKTVLTAVDTDDKESPLAGGTYGYRK